MIALNKYPSSIVLSLSVWFLTSCAPYKVSTESLISQGNENISDNENEKLSHPLYHIVPRHRCQIRWFDLPHWGMWMIFGNDDDGIFGEGPHANFHPQKANTVAKAGNWWLRNPLHNLCFYVIGTAHTKNSEFRLVQVTPDGLLGIYYSPEPSTEFPGKDCCFYAALHGWKPYISLRLVYPNNYRSDFYLGWRCRGNFGAKCVLFTKPKSS